MFSTQEQRDSEKIGMLKQVPISQLVEFKNHTFQIRDDEEMQELKNSIQENGVLEPAIAFMNEEGNIELISGHRRRHACELLSMEEMPVLIKEISRDDAIIMMGESNLQRRNTILPSEKAFTYRYMMEAMSRQGKRNDLASDSGDKTKSRNRLAKKVNESAVQIQRLIRLTHLNKDLLQLVDEKRIALRPAVELSYLPSNLQQYIYSYYQENDVTPNHAQAIQMRQLAKHDLLDEIKINDILSQEKGNQKTSGYKLSDDIMKKYFGNCKTSFDVENRIIKALELLAKQEKIEGKKQIAAYFYGEDELDR